MKLLFFASDYNIGISSILTEQIIAYQNIENWLILGIAGERSQELSLNELIQKQKINLKRILGLDDHKNFFWLYKELKSFIQTEKPDIVHVQNNWQLVLIGLVKYLRISPAKFKIIYTIHGFRNYHPLKSIIARFLIGSLLFVFADRILYLSCYVLTKFRFLSYKMTHIHYGIDECYFKKSINDTDFTNLKLIFPAQFRYGKNQNILIKAFTQYCTEEGDTFAELYLPGDGEFKKECQDLALKLKISDQVYFPGLLQKEDVRNLLQKCNIGVIASNSETYGQAIVESFVLGKCILTTKVGIAPEIIKEGINGFFFTNTEELKNLLIRISKNKNIIAEIGNNNFKSRELFTWANSAKEYCELINNLV